MHTVAVNLILNVPLTDSAVESQIPQAARRRYFTTTWVHA